MKTKLFGLANDPKDEKDEIENYCKTCGMEEVEERGESCEECEENFNWCRCGKPLKEESSMCKICQI